MKPVHILIAEDDTHLRNGLADMLESEGYEVTTAEDGERALELFSQEDFDMVILDIMMPGRSGYDVCRVIRHENRDIPIIMLTAKGEEIDKVVGLQLGADDYVTKPFGVHELLARISAVLRRSKRFTSLPGENQPVQLHTHQKPHSSEQPEHFRFGFAEIDVRQFRGRLGSKTFDLSAREMKLLQFFYAHPGEVLTREQLLNAVWGINYLGTTRTLDQHIAQLRKKIESDPKNPRVIITAHGIGYRYEQ
jgi:DNA-binding response OmpR family regulator